MSIRFTRKDSPAVFYGWGVFKKHWAAAEPGLEPTGRMTPKGRVHRYKTIQLLGKKTKVPIGRFEPKPEMTPAEIEALRQDKILSGRIMRGMIAAGKKK